MWKSDREKWTTCTCYPLLPFVNKEFAGNGGKNQSEQFYGFRLSSARMVIECTFGRLKARFGCLKRDMDINFNDLIHVIHACFILHNFCEIRNESISQQEVKATIKYDREFQPPRQSGYNVGTNDTECKKARQTFIEYFENQQTATKICFIFYRYIQVGKICSKSVK